MGKRPSKKHSIDRIEVNGNYEPENCRWATMKEQANNTRSNRKVTIGEETKNSSQWADSIGVSREVIYKRLKRGIVGTNLLSNKSQPVKFTFNEITDDIAGWSRRTGIKKATLYWRINEKHWPLQKALSKGSSNEIN